MLDFIDEGLKTPHQFNIRESNQAKHEPLTLDVTTYSPLHTQISLPNPGELQT
jgi:hypothetical protein